MTAEDHPPPQGAEVDEALMARAQAGDTDAFAELYDRYSRRAFRIASAICRDQSRAEHAVQEGFLTIWRSRADYRPDAGSFQAWSMRIVKSRAIDSYRRVAARPRTQTSDDYDDRLQIDPNPNSPQGAAVAQSERRG